MCGIAGIYHYGERERPVDKRLLSRMTRVLAHRGPDDEGIFIDGPLGLGHRRLAIVDLSPTGRQPMASDAGSSYIVYNGEFYNHGQFRPGLEAKGHRFRGTSDTETLLRLLEEEGPARLGEISGIFAFAFWDRRRRELLLARDPLGVKQLYYHDDGRRIVFASEIKALLVCDTVPVAVDPVAVSQYLHFHSPLFDRTFFKDIRQVRPGEILRITPAGIERQQYWTIDDFTPERMTPEEAVQRLRHMLTEVVGDQLLSDVPVGAFFSGGIDSSAVASFAARCGKPPVLFGVHFSNQGVIDERPYQEASARALGLELHLTTVDAASFPDDLTRLMYFQDQPVIGHGMLPMYYVSRLASQHVKVCLGGQGADEIFGGYARYGLIQPTSTLSSLMLAPFRNISRSNAGSAGCATKHVRGNLWKQLVDRRNLRRLAGNLVHPFDWRARYFNNFSSVGQSLWQTILVDRRMVDRAACWKVFQATLAQSGADDPATKALHWDVQTYLPGLFQQDDRMSMANGLESRVPLADPRLVRFAFQCDFGLKYRDGASKWILRKAVADVIPPFVLSRRKVGFDTPTVSWMKGPHFDFVRDVLLSKSARERGLWHTNGLERIIDNRSHPLWHDVVWKALCIETWAKVFLDGQFQTDDRVQARNVSDRARASDAA